MHATGQSAGVAMNTVQLPLKQQHLIHQMAEEIVIIEQARYVGSQLLKDEHHKAPGKLELKETDRYEGSCPSGT